MNFIRRFFSGIFTGIDFTRRLLLNLLFWGVLVFVGFALNSGLNPKLGDKFVLSLDIWGDVVEEYQGDALQMTLQRANGELMAQTRLRDLLKVIHAASNDDRVLALELNTDFIGHIAPAQMEELAGALRDFRVTGKSVYAFAQNYGQPAYRLAAESDEVWLDPMGGVFIDGYESYQNYFKDGLEKISADVNVFRVGKYKSAVEPFLRSSMSDEAKEANLAWLTSLWETYSQGLQAARSVDANRIEAYVNDYPALLKAAAGDTAIVALATGFVDKIGSFHDFDTAMTQRWEKYLDQDGLYPIVDHRLYLASQAFDDAIRAAEGAESVAIINVQGVLSDYSAGDGNVSSGVIAEQIDRVIEDDNIKAVVIRVDSPGGAVQTSELIRRDIVRIKDAGKPVVVSMGAVAASGGYWISANADSIWAEPNTITGSIGIFGMVSTWQNSLERIGVYTDGVGTAANSGGWRIDRALSEDSKQIFQSTLERGYKTFIELVAAGRGLDIEATDVIAQGRVWSGIDAKERGLVDELGGLTAATKHAAELAGLSGGWQTKVSYPTRSPLEEFLHESAFGAASTNIASTSLSKLVTSVATAFSTPENIALIKLQSVLGNSATARMLQQNLLQPPANAQQALYAVCACDVTSD
jgi:protease-4